MRILFLGDIVGRAGRKIVYKRLPELIARHGIDCTIINGENSAGGFGITEKIYLQLIDAGADAITLGNHAFAQREALVFIERYDTLLRPINYPAGTPGPGACLIETRNDHRVLAINAMGRIFMNPLDDPFDAIEEAIDRCRLKDQADAIIVDIHAEATSEKQALAYSIDGRVSLVAGTHTHVPTADARILKGGTAFISDVGMCGDYTSVIGMQQDEPIQRFQTAVARDRLVPARGPAMICGVAVDTDDATGLARHVAPLRLGDGLRETVPDFWENAEKEPIKA